jgi:hypothetical protein
VVWAGGTGNGGGGQGGIVIDPNGGGGGGGAIQPNNCNYIPVGANNNIQQPVTTIDPPVYYGGDPGGWQQCGGDIQPVIADTIKVAPCKQADSLATNANFKQTLKTLQQRNNQESSAAEDLQKEHGYIEVHNTNTSGTTISQSRFIAGKPNYGADKVNIDLESELNYLDSLTSFTHTHPEVGTRFFSAEDIIVLARLYKEGYIYDITNFSFNVVPHNNAPYMIKINDAAKFKAFSDTYYNKSAAETLEDKFKNRKMDDYDATAKKVEHGMLTLIKEFNMGLSLFKGNSNFDQWQELGLSTNGKNVVNILCQ